MSETLEAKYARQRREQVSELEALRAERKQSEDLQPKEIAFVLRTLLSRINAYDQARDSALAFGVLFDKYAYLKGWQLNETDYLRPVAPSEVR